jgi:hypothetical protein
LQQNSAASYYDKFALIVQGAFLDKYLTEDYTLRVNRISNVETFRQILDDGELQLLLTQPIDDELVYRVLVAPKTVLRPTGNIAISNF